MDSNEPTIAPSDPVMLFKVVLQDGRAPYKRSYVWSLPTQDANGAWMPGAWHEESTVGAGVGTKGLHLTAEPGWVLKYQQDPHATYVVEAEGVVGDPLLDSQVIAARVRLLRPATDDEIEAATTRWNTYAEARAAAEQQRHEAQVAQWKAEEIERKKKAQRRKLAAMRKAAAERESERQTVRKAGVLSTALLYLRMTEEAIRGLSDTRRHRAYHDALRFAVEWLAFEKDDVHRISVEVERLSDEDLERLYTDALEKKNESAARSVEHALDRKPWWYSAPRFAAERRRLSVGATFEREGTLWEVTSFRDTEGYLNAKKVIERPSLGGETVWFHGSEWAVTKWERAKGTLQAKELELPTARPKVARFTRADFKTKTTRRS